MTLQTSFTLVVACALGACATSDDVADTSADEVQASGNNGEFIIRVLPTGEVDKIDPILSPGASASHVHAFFGAEDVTSTSTLTELETHPTTAQDEFDTAGYWVPELYWNGNPSHTGCTGSAPNFDCGSNPNTTYYARAYYTTVVGSSTVQLPRLMMVTGYPDAKKDPSITDSSSTNRVYYTCGASPSKSTPNSKWPYDCDKFSDPAFDGVVMIVDFPSCWNGKASGTMNGEKVVQYVDKNVKGDVTNDLAYAEGNGCPSGFGLRIPRVSFRLHTKIKNPANDGNVIWPSTCAGSTFACQTQASSPTNVGIGLSSDDGTPGGWYTFHAHYAQSWQMGNVTGDFSKLPPPDQTGAQPGTLNYLTQDCLDHPQTCGFQPNAQGKFVGQTATLEQ